MRRTGVKHTAYALSNAVARENLAAGNPKFHAGETPLEQEAALKVIEPTSEQQLKELMNMIDLMYVDAGPQQRKALDFYKGQMAVDGATNAVKMRFLRRFYFWLLGRGTNDDHAKTLWGRGNVAVYNAEVAAYIEQFVEKRLQYALQLSLLAQRIPVSLNGYYLYFKYIVNGELRRAKGTDNIEFWDLSNDDFLKDFEVLAQYFDGQVNYREIIKPAATRPSNAAPFGAKGTPFVGVRGSTEPYPAGHENDGEVPGGVENSELHLENNRMFALKAASGVADKYSFDDSNNRRNPPPPAPPGAPAPTEDESEDYADSPAETGFETDSAISNLMAEMDRSTHSDQHISTARFLLNKIGDTWNKMGKATPENMEKLHKSDKIMKEAQRLHDDKIEEMISSATPKNAEIAAQKLQKRVSANERLQIVHKHHDAAQQGKIQDLLSRLKTHLHGATQAGDKTALPTAKVVHESDVKHRMTGAAAKGKEELDAVVEHYETATAPLTAAPPDVAASLIDTQHKVYDLHYDADNDETESDVENELLTTLKQSQKNAGMRNDREKARATKIADDHKTTVQKSANLEEMRIAAEAAAKHLKDSVPHTDNATEIRKQAEVTHDFARKTAETARESLQDVQKRIEQNRNDERSVAKETAKSAMTIAKAVASATASLGLTVGKEAVSMATDLAAGTASAVYNLTVGALGAAARGSMAYLTNNSALPPSTPVPNDDTLSTAIAKSKGRHARVRDAAAADDARKFLGNFDPTRRRTTKQ